MSSSVIALPMAIIVSRCVGSVTGEREALYWPPRRYLPAGLLCGAEISQRGPYDLQPEGSIRHVIEDFRGDRRTEARINRRQGTAEVEATGARQV